MERREGPKSSALYHAACHGRSSARSPNLPRGRRGLGLVEVMIAVTILLLAVVPMVELFATAGRQTRQTSNYGLSIALEEKVAEELRLASWENVYALDELERSSDLGVAKPVTGGRSRFFEAIEDEQPPLGRLQPGIDPAIEQGCRPLFDELKTFEFRLDGRQRGAPGGGTVLDLTLRTRWLDFQGRQHDLVLQTAVGRFGPPPDDELPGDRGSLDQRIREVLYPDRTGRTLAQVVEEVGGELSTVRLLGDVVVVAEHLVGTASSVELTVGRLREQAATAGNPGEAALLTVALARKLEGLVVCQISSMARLAPVLAVLATTFSPSQLGRPPVPLSSYQWAVMVSAWLPSTFASRLGEAQKEYARVCEGALGKALPPRVRTRALLKLLELCKLQVLTCGPHDPVYVSRLAQYLRETHQDRNPNFAALAEAEMLMATTFDHLAATYRAQNRSKAWSAYLAAVLPSVPRLLGGRQE